MQANHRQGKQPELYNMKKRKQLVFGMAVGIAIGTAVGVATDNIALWLPVGIAIGAGVGNSLMK